MSSLIIELRPGDRLALTRHGDEHLAVLEPIKKSGQLVRLRVTAPPDIRIERARDDSRDEAVSSWQA
jgi:hypothetical protein